MTDVHQLPNFSSPDTTKTFKGGWLGLQSYKRPSSHLRHLSRIVQAPSLTTAPLVATSSVNTRTTVFLEGRHRTRNPEPHIYRRRNWLAEYSFAEIWSSDEDGGVFEEDDDILDESRESQQISLVPSEKQSLTTTKLLYSTINSLIHPLTFPHIPFKPP